MNNTFIRSLSGLIFLVIMTGGILAGPVIYGVIMLFAILVMNFEYVRLASPLRSKVPLFFTLLSSATLFITTFIVKYYSVNPALLSLNIIPILCIFVSMLYYKSKADDQSDSGMLAGSVIYTALPFVLTNFIVFRSGGTFFPYILLSFFFILWASDVGAYIFGITFGQKNGHKLFPSVSPNKSWEGFAGGLLLAVITGLILHFSGFWDINLLHSIIISIIISTIGAIGDLVESKFKRIHNVKDSGNIMPGHGGLLDRFDGALLAFPAAIVYLIIFKLI